jgi:hypothetical protein
MKCNEICELMPDLAAGLSAATPEMNNHLKACPDCTGKLEEFRQTMALMDAWQAPEPSPYFDVRVMARMREEKAKPSGWLYWLRKPALAISLAALMVMSATLITDTNWKKAQPIASIEPGTAVSDLEALDKNSELYADFDVLDDLQVQQDVNANP